MAHHAPDPGEDTPLARLPRRSRATLLAAAVSVLAVAVAVTGLWAAGGFEASKSTDFRDVAPGKLVRNSLLELKLHEAAFTQDPDTGAHTLQIRADIKTRFNEPVPVSNIGGMIDPRFGRKDLAATSMSMVFTRQPDRSVFELQPEVNEEAVLTWQLKDEDPDAKPKSAEEVFSDEDFLEPDDVSEQVAQVDQVKVTVTGASYDAGFTDQTKRWWGDTNTRGIVYLPIEE
ncbi:hypothetical protein O4J56_01740 [Nocardiopsis sp. RSe5-2]|uniref:Uncharacterized protein n=1 Tax=Nocardiopsis endophytica TaxID=3018445 RepID=A0ABT4TXE0_9ACTN|nr:hypothetical protein [Nocardiopsis endophytica]MDA2809347.1 hypothetical protein [Nocardiopsis endophytica]